MEKNRVRKQKTAQELQSRVAELEQQLAKAQAEIQGYADKLERSSRELDEFASLASHDLQEPLRIAELYGKMLLEDDVEMGEQDRERLKRMQKAIGRMREMVDGLLKLSRVSTQGQPWAPVDLSRVASEVLSDLEDQIRRTGGKVEVEPLPGVEGDPLQLRQLIQNLIGNGLKFQRADTPPQVKVRAQELPDKVQIVVEDNGIGFEQSYAERIFQPFERLVGRSQYEGTGLGLAICRRIVQRHGGEISASASPNEGATFIVTLPIHQGEHREDEPGKDQ